MPLLFNAFLLGTTSGLRALLGITVLSWAARLGYVHLGHTWLAFLGFTYTPYILTVLALGELVNDKLPRTPSRLIPPQFIARLITGSLCGIGLGLSRSLSLNHLIACLLAGILGSVLGTLGGAKARGFVAHFFRADLPAALLEDLVGIGLATWAVGLLH
jgi:uncharacterized membrane protein